jgi:hypothetical protein
MIALYIYFILPIGVNHIAVGFGIQQMNFLVYSDVQRVFQDGIMTEVAMTNHIWYQTCLIKGNNLG